MSDETRLGVRVRAKDGTWYLTDIAGVAYKCKGEAFCRSVPPECWLEWLRGAVIEPGPGTDCMDG